MWRKRESEGREHLSPRTGSETTEGRMSATGGAGYDVRPVPERAAGATGATGAYGAAEPAVETRARGAGEAIEAAGERISAAGRSIRRAGEEAGADIGEAGRRAAARVAEIRDVTAERLGEAGQAAGDAIRQVHIEDFLLRGDVAGHPFRLELEGNVGEERFFAFEVDLRTDDGDIVHVSGRKRVLLGNGGGHAGEGYGAGESLAGEGYTGGERVGTAYGSQGYGTSGAVERSREGSPLSGRGARLGED